MGGGRQEEVEMGTGRHQDRMAAKGTGTDWDWGGRGRERDGWEGERGGPYSVQEGADL